MTYSYLFKYKYVDFINKNVINYLDNNHNPQFLDRTENDTDIGKVTNVIGVSFEEISLNGTKKLFMHRKQH